MTFKCLDWCIASFLTAVRRDPDDPRTHLMRVGEFVYWWISIIATMLSLALLGLGIHLRLYLDSHKPAITIAAAVIGGMVEVAPYLLPSAIAALITWWRRRRMGVDDYFMSRGEQARIAHNVFKINLVNYFIGVAISLAATVVWAKLPAPELRSGQRLALGKHCGGFLLANGTMVMNPPNDTMDYIMPISHQLCHEAGASYTLLCCFVMLQAMALFVEMLIFTLPSKKLFQ
ncbi:hypothetical protein KEM56_002813 [Ascosphaera pollenicola]|nr:hypothetical protein KEM56_002813 [Ascosphaera pollenicola]